MASGERVNNILTSRNAFKMAATKLCFVLADNYGTASISHLSDEIIKTVYCSMKVLTCRFMCLWAEWLRHSDKECSTQVLVQLRYAARKEQIQKWLLLLSSTLIRVRLLFQHNTWSAITHVIYYSYRNEDSRNRAAKKRSIHYKWLI